VLLNVEFKLLHTNSDLFSSSCLWRFRGMGQLMQGLVDWKSVDQGFTVLTTTWYHIPEECNINIHCHENTRYSVILLFWLYDVTLGCILMFIWKDQSWIRWINMWAELVFFMFLWFSWVCWPSGIYFVLVCFSTLAGLQTTRKCTIQHPSFLKCKIGKRQLSSS